MEASLIRAPCKTLCWLRFVAGWSIKRVLYTRFQVDVFLSQALSPTLHLLQVKPSALVAVHLFCSQYPLRPAHLPVEPASVQSVRVRSESNQVQLQLAVSAYGENYSRSRGEAYARDADMAPSQTTPLYRR